MLRGDSLPMQLIERRLTIGERLGQVPDETPSLPLAADLAKLSRSLRLRPSAERSELVLDLRKPNDRKKSQLLRRLVLIDVPWGIGGDRGEGARHLTRSCGPLCWEPELSVRIIEAAALGNTLEEAATARAAALAEELDELEDLTQLAHDALLADLAAASEPIMAQLASRAASSDASHLVAALPPLCDLLRYGDVRGAAADGVAPLVVGLTTRLSVGLVPACARAGWRRGHEAGRPPRPLPSRAGTARRSRLVGAAARGLGRAVARRARARPVARARDTAAPRRGRARREIAAQRFSLAVSKANEPGDVAAWLEGLLRGAGQLLIYDDALWRLVDEWVTTLGDAVFDALLPLLRLTFATFEGAERRQMAQRVTAGAR